MPVTEQLKLRFDACREQLEYAGMFSPAPRRFVGVLTGDAPGEILELSIVEASGKVWTQRFTPQRPITPMSSRIHGLRASDFPEGKYPTFADMWPEVQERLTRPMPTGETAELTAWAGEFIEKSLALTLGVQQSPLQVKDVQSLIYKADLELAKGEYPRKVYYPTLTGMRFTVPIKAQDNRASLSSAVLTRTMLHFFREGVYQTQMPQLEPRSA